MAHPWLSCFAVLVAWFDRPRGDLATLLAAPRDERVNLATLPVSELDELAAILTLPCAAPLVATRCRGG